MLPVVVVAHDLLRGRYERDWKGFWNSIWSTVPLWITAAAYMVVRIRVLHGLAHSVNEPVSHILLTIPTIFWGYMRRLVWPVNMSVFYDTPPVTHLIDVRFWLPALALVLAMVFAWRIGKRSHLTGLALIWIFVFLAPAIIGLPEFPRGEWVHDRYLYLPSFGFCLLLVHAISQFASEREIFRLPAIPSAITLLLVAAMALGTTYEEQFWANDLLLFAHATRIAPNSAWAKTHLANELYRRRDLKDVEPLYQAALRIDPKAWKIRVSYGLVLFYLNDYRRAEEQLTAAIQQAPFDSNPYFYQGLSRFNLQNYKGAEESFKEALARDPEHARYHFWLGFAYEKEDRLDEAKAQYKMELKEHPETDTVARERLQALEK
jgi:Tfp pilus assembly protein PilF